MLCKNYKTLLLLCVLPIRSSCQSETSGAANAHPVSVHSKKSPSLAEVTAAVNSLKSKKSSIRSDAKVPQTLSEWYALLDKTLQDGGAETDEGHSSEEANPQTLLYSNLSTAKEVKTICEIGFNAGHSALRFLAQGRARLYEFDLGQHRTSSMAARFMKTHFGDRFSIVWGDSKETVPRFAREHPDASCDVIIVDGGHTFEDALIDLMNMEALASEMNILVIDDTNCENWWCDGPTEAWKMVVQEGFVVETMPDPGYSFSVGQYTRRNQLNHMFLRKTGHSLRAISVRLLCPLLVVALCFYVRPIPTPLVSYFRRHSKQ